MTTGTVHTICILNCFTGAVRNVKSFLIPTTGCWSHTLPSRFCKYLHDSKHYSVSSYIFHINISSYNFIMNTKAKDNNPTFTRIVSKFRWKNMCPIFVIFQFNSFHVNKNVKIIILVQKLYNIRR